jgi:hypothetical protein
MNFITDALPAAQLSGVGKLRKAGELPRPFFVM